MPINCAYWLSAITLVSPLRALMHALQCTHTDSLRCRKQLHYLLTRMQSYGGYHLSFVPFLPNLQAPLNKLQDQTCKRVLHAVRHNRLIAEVSCCSF
jgi:hypothetical protein